MSTPITSGCTVSRWSFAGFGVEMQPGDIIAVKGCWPGRPLQVTGVSVCLNACQAGGGSVFVALSTLPK